MTVDASFAELPYGQAWKVVYGGSDEIEIEINNAPPRFGTLSGKIQLATDDSDRLRKAVQQQRFYELSTHIANGYPLHHPDLRLRITMVGKTHEVQLYSPRTAESHPEAARFLVVWNELFALLPVRPSWD